MASLKIVSSRTLQSFRTKLTSPPFSPHFRQSQRSFSSFGGRAGESYATPQVKSFLKGASALLSLLVGSYVCHKIGETVGEYLHPSKERLRNAELEVAEMLRVLGIQNFSSTLISEGHSKFTNTIKFEVPPSCEIPCLAAKIVSHLGVADDHDAGSHMIVGASESEAGWKLTLNYLQKLNGIGWSWMQKKDVHHYNGVLNICMSRNSSDGVVVEFNKQGSFTANEMKAVISVISLAANNYTRTVGRFVAMGLKIYGLNRYNLGHSTSDISWDAIAGYNQQKRVIEDMILMRGASGKGQNRPKAVLFEGPPGTGKTSIAHVIGKQGVPVVYVPMQIIMSEYYDQSERLLQDIFSFANVLPNGAIIFLDEVDAIALAHGVHTEEVTQGLLSVLLQQADGSEPERKSVIVAATNRKQDLHPALLSAFEVMLHFELPDFSTRQEIATRYAKHLTGPELAEFAAATEKMSGRDIRDVCQQTENNWASKRTQKDQLGDDNDGSLPPLQEYLQTVASWL